MSNKLEEIEQKYLACEQSNQLSAPPAKKRGRKRKSDKTFEQNFESSSAMAELAASLQISHFHKVCEPYVAGHGIKLGLYYFFILQ